MAEHGPSSSNEGERNVTLCGSPQTEGEKTGACEAEPGNSAPLNVQEMDEKVIVKDNSELKTEGDEISDIKDDVQEVPPIEPERRLSHREVAWRIGASVSAAREAASACRTVIESSYKAVGVAEKRSLNNQKKYEKEDRRTVKYFYRRIATDLENAARLTSESATAAKIAADEAEMAADEAEAIDLRNSANESPNSGEHVRTAIRAERNALDKANKALKKEYATLIEMYYCLAESEEERLKDLPRHTGAYNAFCEAQGKLCKIAVPGTFATGVIVLIESFVSKEEYPDFTAIMGIALIVVSLILLLWWIVRCFKRRKIASELESRRIAIRAIYERLGALDEYFGSKNIHNEYAEKHPSRARNRRRLPVPWMSSSCRTLRF